MSAQGLESYNREGTGGSAWRGTFAREEYALCLLPQNVGIRLRSRSFAKQSANTVFRVARQMMRNNEDAEDVVQESFQQAFIHLKSFKGDSRFSTWLSRIAINAALMKLRKKHRKWMCRWMNRPKSMSSSSRLDVEDQGLNPEQLYAQKERERILL